MYAVITGDIVGSTTSEVGEPPTKYGKIDDSLTQAFDLMITKGWMGKSDFVAFRGDSFQCLLPVEHGLEGALLIKAALKGGGTDLTTNGAISWSCRLAIGIGAVTYRAEHVSKSNGPAFHQSGRMLDAMSRERFMAISSPWGAANEELDLMCRYLDIIIERLWTAKSARTVWVHFKEEYTQREMAELFGISQSAMNQRIQVAELAVLEQTVKRYQSIIKTNIQ